MALYGDILNLSRQAQRGPVSSWFERRLRDQSVTGCSCRRRSCNGLVTRSLMS